MPASLSTAQIVQECPSSDICYSLSVPDTTSSAGSGDIYFQIQAPTTYEWVALGQGSSMSGANIFVLYTDSTGQNVTLSPRLGTGNVQPRHNSAAQAELLEGTGVADGVMTANVRCSSCSSWSGGSMDFSQSSASWIYAWYSGDALNTDELNANINQHQQASSFDWDLSAAVNSENVNPFVAGSTTDSGSGTTTGSTDSGSVPATCTPIAANADGSSATATSGSSTASSTSSSSSDDDNWDGTGRPPWADDDQQGPPDWWNDDDNNNSKLRRRQSTSDACPSGYAPISASNGGSSSSSGGPPASSTIILAHAVLACLAFVGLFPIGGILIRVASFTGLVWVHAAVQCLAYVLYIAAFGIGVWMATNMGYISSAHPIIGIVLLLVLLGQPLFGFLHHKLFKKYQHRTLWSYVHIGIGRIAILLGMVNGGLGLQLAGSRGSSVIAYGVIAGIVGLTYIAAIIFGETKRRRGAANARGSRLGAKGERPPNYEDSEELEYYGNGGRS